MKNPPCKGCDKRHPACHDQCAPYKEWKEYQTALKIHVQETTRPQEADIIRARHIDRLMRERNSR